MRKELLAKEKLFFDTVATLDEIIVEELGFSARSALETGELNTGGTGPILITVMKIALATLLVSKGAHPNAVLGLSNGAQRS